MTVTHVRHWHAHYHSGGTGPFYQGRFKPFPMQGVEHFLTVCRYVERNALRANLVKKAENWRWSSLWHRVHDTQVPWLSRWPMAVPEEWTANVNQSQTESELEALRRSVTRGAPFGNEQWQKQTAKALGVESSMRSRGRPRKTPVQAEI